jgi:hypothetical protein
MARTTIADDSLKQALKKALSEAFQEQRGLLREVFSEVLEDFALAEAIRQGQKTKMVKRNEVIRILSGKR